VSTKDEKRTIRVFFYSQFEIAATAKGDTVFYDPSINAILHYEGSRAFLLAGEVEGRGMSDWTVGLSQIEGKEGTFRDAEDGVLTQNPIEHGRVDSTFALEAEVHGNTPTIFHQWLCIADSIEHVLDLHEDVLSRSPEYLASSARSYWHAWITRSNWNFYALPASVSELFLKSQFVLRSHADKNGAVIASGDADMLQGGRDTYCYMWPRDGAYIASAFIKADDFAPARRFFEFCSHVLTHEGYMQHKYRPDGALGSSWHGWVVNHKKELPIQEDETALTLWALKEYWSATRDMEFIESIYDSFIKKAGYFLVSHRDVYSGLPKPSYDLWEERFGVHTYTAAATYAGLLAAGEFSTLLGKERNAADFFHVAEDMRTAILKHLYNEQTGNFYRLLYPSENNTYLPDGIIDASSAYGVFIFGVLDVDDERLVRAMNQMKAILTVPTPVGGIARYLGDKYYNTTGIVQGNPWVITSLWSAQYDIARAHCDNDLDIVREKLERIARFGGPIGILPEQLHPDTAAPLSASPLAWSHAEYVRTVVLYLQKCKALGIISHIHQNS
jgi:GH15 family glucan-1,4-alpha-glucosidase